MADTRTVHDPFLGKNVEVSNRLVDRLRGRYANGPTMPNGEPEFGWREFQTPPIQHEAAAEIERLCGALQDIERKYQKVMGPPPDWTIFTEDQLRWVREAWYGASLIARKALAGKR